VESACQIKYGGILREDAGNSQQVPGHVGHVPPYLILHELSVIGGRELRAVKVGLIVGGDSFGRILSEPSNRSRALVCGLGVEKKGRALELGLWKKSPGRATHAWRNSPAQSTYPDRTAKAISAPDACIENVENQCSPKNRCPGEKVPEGRMRVLMKARRVRVKRNPHPSPLPAGEGDYSTSRASCPSSSTSARRWPTRTPGA